MSTQSILLLIVFLAVLLALAWPLGILLARIGDGSATPMRKVCSSRASRPKRSTWRATGSSTQAEPTSMPEKHSESLRLPRNTASCAGSSSVFGSRSISLHWYQLAL